jgi:hypothetical protein
VTEAATDAAKYQSRTWWAVGAVLLTIGVALRSALYFPLAMFPIDSDGVLAGLCGFRVLEGHYPAFFPGGARLSAASCYVAAALFRLVGPDRIALALTGLTWSVLYLIFTLLFLRATLGPKSACLAFVFAVVPPAAFVTVTYVPWAYGEIAASCAATLWLAVLWRYDGRLWQRLAFGISLGFGIWISLQTLMIALPATLWILLQRRRKIFAESTPAIAGAVLGALPFLAANAAHGFVSFASNWAAQPASSLAQVGQNVVWLVSSPLPQLLFNGFSTWRSPSTTILIGLLVIGIGFAMAIRRDARDANATIDAREAAGLLLLVLTVSLLLYVFSEAGSVRGWTVRYIAPVYVVLPLILGIGAATLWRIGRWLAIAGVGLILIPNLLLYSLPVSAERAQLTYQLRSDVALRRQLALRHVRMVYGDYFAVYHLNFDSREHIAGIPTLAESDYMHYADALPQRDVRWALLGYSPDQLAAWARAVGARGAVLRIGDRSLFVSDRPASYMPNLLAKLRAGSR